MCQVMKFSVNLISCNGISGVTLLEILQMLVLVTRHLVSKTILDETNEMTRNRMKTTVLKAIRLSSLIKFCRSIKRLVHSY